MSNADIPEHFICPITLEIMEDPVVASDGVTYEKKAIATWFTKKKSSPTTNKQLRTKTLISNKAIKFGIQKFLAERKSGSKSSSKRSMPTSHMQLIVLCNHRGGSITIEVDKNDDVDQLKEEIEYKEGIFVEEQRLIFGGKQLDSGYLLRDYGIVAGCTIHLVTRVPGGGQLLIGG